MNHLFGFLHVGAMSHNLDVGSSISTTQELTAHRRVTVVNDHGGHFLNRLISIEIRIEKRIKERHYDEEHYDTHISQGALHLVSPHIYCIS